MRVPIFYYHSVGGSAPQTLAAEEFARHLDAIDRHGFRTLTVAEVLRGAGDGRCVCLTFDDGLLDNHGCVLPMLAERGHRATFYVVPAYEGRTRWVEPRRGRWSDEARPGFTVPFPAMDRGHWRDLLAAGMEVGSHSLTHRDMTRLGPEELDRETRGSREALEEALGVEVETFCYPRGRPSSRVLQAVAAAGYQGACSTLPGLGGGRFILRRFLVEDPAVFEALLLGAWPWPAAMGWEVVSRGRRPGRRRVRA